MQGLQRNVVPEMNRVMFRRRSMSVQLLIIRVIARILIMNMNKEHIMHLGCCLRRHVVRHRQRRMLKKVQVRLHRLLIHWRRVRLMIRHMHWIRHSCWCILHMWYRRCRSSFSRRTRVKLLHLHGRGGQFPLTHFSTQQLRILAFRRRRSMEQFRPVVNARAFWFVKRVFSFLPIELL